MSYRILILILIILLIILIIFLCVRKNESVTEAFRSKKGFDWSSRSVELWNPSAYTGLLTRKFEVPLAYTRNNDINPLYNRLRYPKKTTVIKAPWNIAEILPLQSRRLMLL